MSDLLKILAGVVGLISILVGYWIKRASEQPFKRRHRVIDELHKNKEKDIAKHIEDNDFVALGVDLDELTDSLDRLQKENRDKTPPG